MAYREAVGAGIAGLALAYSLNIVVNLQFSVKTATQVESFMNGVERLVEYSDMEIERDMYPCNKSSVRTIQA